MESFRTANAVLNVIMRSSPGHARVFEHSPRLMETIIIAVAQAPAPRPVPDPGDDASTDSETGSCA